MLSKLAFDAKRAFHNGTGLGNYSRDFIKLLKNHASKLGLFTPKGGRFAHQFQSERIEIIHPQGFFASIFPSYWRTFGITKWLKNSDYTHYHGLSAELPYGIAHWSGKKIVSIHDLIFEKHPQWYKPIDRWLYSRKAQYACQVADKIIAISKQTASDIQEVYQVDASKIAIIPPLCHPGFYDQPSTIRPAHLPKKFILYVGTIEPRKGLHLIIEALEILDEDIPLIVVGKINAKYFITFAQGWNALSNKGLLRHLSPAMDDLIALYDACEFLVYPSQAEGYGMPIMEAALRGKSSIVGTSPCLVEAGGSSAWALQSNDSHELADKIHTWWHNPELLAQKSLQAKEHSQNYYPAMILEKIAAVYDLKFD